LQAGAALLDRQRLLLLRQRHQAAVGAHSKLQGQVAQVLLLGVVMQRCCQQA
jgi:hypothetical protein